MESSDIILRADGIPFRYVVFVTPRELEKQKCTNCDGDGKVGTNWLDDGIKTCPRCQGCCTMQTLRFVDYELEAHLKVCMDEYIKRRYINKEEVTMNLRDELQQLADHAVTDNPQIVVAYEHVVRSMKARTKNGERSCDLGHTGLGVEQVKALKQRLRNENVEVIEHPGDPIPFGSEPGYTELRW